MTQKTKNMPGMIDFSARIALLGKIQPRHEAMPMLSEVVSDDGNGTNTRLESQVCGLPSHSGAPLESLSNPLQECRIMHKVERPTPRVLAFGLILCLFLSGCATPQAPYLHNDSGRMGIQITRDLGAVKARWAGLVRAK
jgi:hypothetical protein